MPKLNKRKKENNEYNADNEIIIGVTTKQKEKEKQKQKPKNKQTTKKTASNNKKKSNIKNHKNRTSMQEKKTEIKKINTKKILISIVFLVALIIGGIIYYLTTPVFNVASINIYGNEKNTADTYISLSKININDTNIFAFTNESIKRNLKENAYVEDVKIKRKLPNTLEIHVTERKADYQVKHLNTYVYLNNQGYVLEINEEKIDAPIINGLSSINTIQIGNRLDNEDLIRLDTVLKVINYCKYNMVEYKLTSIDTSDISNYILQFGKEGKTAYIGDSTNITEKMTAVANILEAEKGKKGNIHAEEEALKRNRVYFSELEE